MQLHNQTVVLTGGTSGVGRALLDLLLARQCRVVVIGRDAARLAALRQALPAIQVEACDLADPRAVQALIGRLTQQYPACSVLINNAGVQHNYTLGAAPMEDQARIEAEINTNLTAAVQLCAGLLPVLRQQPQAAILNITSGLALSPKRTAPVYCATKAGLRLFTKALRYQLEDAAVQVSEGMLPLVDTPMTAGRGRGKISAEQAAAELIRGLERGEAEINVGKVKVFRLLHRLLPGVADRLLKGG